jgi:hypothetical protein
MLQIFCRRGLGIVRKTSGFTLALERRNPAYPLCSVSVFSQPIRCYSRKTYSVSPALFICLFFSEPTTTEKKNNLLALYVVVGVIVVLGLSYLAVPLYRIFCQVTGFGGTPHKGTLLLFLITNLTA